jgi:hypothetical protein
MIRFRLVRQLRSPNGAPFVLQLRFRADRDHVSLLSREVRRDNLAAKVRTEAFVPLL